MTVFGQGKQKNVSGGTATMTIGPVPPGQIWKVFALSIDSSNVTTAECKVYHPTIGINTMVDTTYDGTRNRSTTDITMMPGDSIHFVWSAVTPLSGCSVYGRIDYRLETF